MNRLIIRLFSMGILVCLSLMSAKSQTPGLTWARALNGTGPGVAYPESIVTDAAKNVYSVGSFRNTIDANPGAGTFLLTSAGQADIFVSKLDAAGNFVWALRIGGTGSDVAQAITLDVLGNVYLTGSFTGTVDFDPGPGIVNLAGGGSFAFSLDANGSLNWAGRIGSGTGKAIAIDAADNLLVGGDFTGSSDFDPGAGTVTLTSAGSVDIFVSKFALDGTLIWAKQMGGTAADFCFGVDTDATNNIYTSGGFSGTADFNPGVAVNNLTSAGLSDIYISKLDAAGAYVLAVKIGGTGSESTNSLTVDGGGNVLLAGDYAGTVDFDPGASVSNLTSAGSSDIFVAKYSSTGAHIWSRSVGGPSSDRPSHVITDAVGDVYMTGNFQGTADFDPGAGVFNLVAGTGNQEAYVSKLTSAGNFSWALRTESTASGETEGIAVALDTSGDILIAGWFELIVDFDPGSCVYSLPSNGDDIFVMKLSPSSLGCIPPTITSFSPASGPVGTTVIIDGLQFSPTPSNNTVYFGAVRANVTAATTTQLTVTVPPGVAHDRISVMVGGLVGLSRDPFLLNYGYNQVIGPSSFAPKIDLSAGLEPYALAQGDFDLDGRVDLVSANYSGSTVSVFQNSSSGPGNIGYAAKVDFTVGLGRPYAITAGDFDGDGKQDFAVANEFTNTVAVFRNTSSGPGNINFAPRVEFATGAFPHGITAADFNYDGKLDLAVTSNNLDVVSVYSNLSSGSGNINFAPRIDFAAGDASQDVTHADLDLDGRPDLIVTNYSAQSISVLRNTSASGAINFAAKTDITTGTLPNFVSTGDVDGDGKLDLTVANALSETISIFRNLSSPGAITLAGKADVSAIGAFAVGLGDLNGDGKVDLAVPDFGSNVTAIQNTSAGPGNVAFGIQQGFATGNTPQFVGIGDYDGDGKPDLAVANQSSNSISILRNTVPIPPPTISSFTPASGPVGTTVTIAGSSFSSTPSNNIVYFGGVRANVVSATPTQLTVTVPTGSTYAPITVTVGGLTAYSNKPFIQTFSSGGVINACALASPVSFSAGTNSKGLDIGDIDGDGKPDVVISSSSLDAVQVFHNQGTPGVIDAATLEAPIQLAAGLNPEAVKLADLDGDGKLDIVVTSTVTNIVSIYRNISTSGSLTVGSFAARFDLATGGSGVWRIVCQDLDLDGRTDLAVANNPSNRIAIFRNIGAPGSIDATTFEPFFLVAGNGSLTAFEVADFDVDGRPDFMVGHSIGNQFGIIRNISSPGSLSAGSFAPLVNFLTGDWLSYTAVGDLDDDSRPDILTVSVISASFSIHKNLSSPGIIDNSSFGPRVIYSTTVTEPNEVTITDMDGDAKPDVALINYVANTVSLYKNVSTPGVLDGTSLAPRVAFTGSGNGSNIVAADMDGDGKPDLINTHWNGPAFFIFRNTVRGNPSVTGYTPASGPPGTVVTIDGTNFSTTLSENVVSFNGKQGYVTAATTTQLTVVVPGGATTGPITVTVGCGTPATTTPFTVTPLVYSTCNAVTLNGAGNYIQVNRNASLEPASLTIEALVNFVTIPSFGVIAAKPDGTVAGDSYAIWYESGLLRAGVRLGGGVSFAWTPVLNQWYHIALTYNGTTQVQRLYVDGEVVASGSSLPPIYSADHLLFGADINFGVHNGFFPGMLDELRMWNTERSPAELLTNLTASLSGSEPGLVLYHKVNETGQGAGITVLNSATSSGPTNNGTTVGNATTPSFANTCSCVPAAQRNALIALYNATDGVNWTDNTGWLSPDESTWTGITVTGCDITDITLPGNNLVGSIPPEIGDLVMLEGLDLGLNQLSGSIPPEIGNLTSLIGLNLAVNQLDGFLPPELGNLTSLEALNLSFNRLGGTPPIELENLLALVDAALNNNQFIGQPPLIGGNSIAMSTVQLQFNEFTALPDFTAYYSINLINVSNNRLTFDDLEPFMAISNFFYDPQALVPPGGIISFIPGGTLSIPFATGGTGNSYQWYKDNVLIPGATSASLSVPGVTAADVGFYHVRITSSVVPFLVLQSMVYTVITDPCTASTPTSGDIDPTFAPLIDVPSFFTQVEVQSTGRIIAESSSTVINSVSHQGLLRFLPDGTLDNSFAANLYTSPFLVQSNDHILATSNSGTYAYVVRLDAQGNEDAAFTANVPQYYSGYISAIALQPDNKILVAGSAYLVPTFIERLNPDGTSDGLLPDANGLDVSVIRVQSDGFILVGGQFPGGIIRLDPTGTLDPSFIAHTDGFVSDIAIQSDGKILVSGMFALVNDIPKRGIVRLHPDGSIDNSFTALGITNLIESGLNARQIALQTDGKIVLAGEFSSINGADRINVVRLNTDGSVDCLFNPGTGTDLPITGLALPSDNQILISGNFIDYNGTARLGLARINSGTTASCLPATERAALIALYNSTNGASWTNNTNWLSADESTWHGVIVSSCHVTNINLDNNLLAGPLPPELGDLNQLLTLQLSNNALTGSIPASLPNLGSLISLQLYNNQLTGSIPAGLYGMTTLQTLDLSNNQLSGGLSTSIGNLTNLTSLSLSINQFTGTLPSEIGNLNNLQYLRLALNQFSGSLPTTFGNLTQLREFTVATNLLTGTVPASLANLTNLNVLGLSFNGFTGDLPPGIGSLNALQQVSVRSNQFTSLPAFTSTSITELRTENNRFHFGHLEPNAGKAGFTYTPQANLAGGSATTCEGTTLTIPFTTPGTANQYQWYKDGVLIPGATASTFNKSSATPGDAGNYVVQVTNTLVPGLTLVSDPFVVSINGAPSAPTVTGATSCTAGTLTLTASGGSPGEYRWYATATGGTDLGTGVGTFVTPVISVTTLFHVAINNGTCESTRTPVAATIDAVAKPAITTSNCTASGATLSGPAGFASYAWSNGATTSQISVTTGGTYTLVVTSAGGCVSPASDAVTFTNSFCNQPPALQPTPVTTTVQSTVTVNISAMASDLDNNIDLSTLQVINQPASGATAFINANFELVIDYSSVSFAGTDQLTIQLCDVAGACVQEVITVEVAGEITVFNALSPNGDGKNDVFFIQYINALPETQQNKVTILNRWGTVVFETSNYDNNTNVFRGLSSGGDELPSGTYYYILEFSSGAAKRTGFISLRR